jgi:protein-tyrosine phosphatase
VAIVEILHNALWQADADPNIFAKLRERDLAPLMLIDLQELPAPGIPLEGDIVYVHWPIDDGGLPDLSLLRALEHAACQYIDQGGRVVTMCAQGRNRSGLLSALIVARVRRCSGLDAVRHVRSKVPEALNNADFAEWIERLR